MKDISLAVLDLDSWSGISIGATHVYATLILVSDKSITVDNVHENGVYGEKIEVKKLLTDNDIKEMKEKEVFEGMPDFNYKRHRLSKCFNTIEEATEAGIDEFKKLKLNVDFVSTYRGDVKSFSVSLRNNNFTEGYKICDAFSDVETGIETYQEAIERLKKYDVETYMIKSDNSIVSDKPIDYDKVFGYYKEVYSWDN